MKTVAELNAIRAEALERIALRHANAAADAVTEMLRPWVAAWAVWVSNPTPEFNNPNTETFSFERRFLFYNPQSRLYYKKTYREKQYDDRRGEIKRTRKPRGFKRRRVTRPKTTSLS